MSNLALNGVFQFQWEPFDGTFTATSSQVTIALKTGSFFTFDAAGHHDDLVLEEVASSNIPVNSPWALVVLCLGLLATGAWMRRGPGMRRG